jgi:hypothetical protein
MRQSSNLAVAFASVPRRRIASNVQWIRLRLAVSSAQVFMLRQTLHRAIGNLARVYVVEVDHRHGETTLHVEVGAKTARQPCTPSWPRCPPPSLA